MQQKPCKLVARVRVFQTHDKRRLLLGNHDDWHEGHDRIKYKGWIDHFQRPEVLNVAKDESVILISFRGGCDLTGSFIKVLLSYGGVILNAGLKITSLVNDLGKD